MSEKARVGGVYVCTYFGHSRSRAPGQEVNERGDPIPGRQLDCYCSARTPHTRGLSTAAPTWLQARRRGRIALPSFCMKRSTLRSRHETIRLYSYSMRSALRSPMDSSLPAPPLRDRNLAGWTCCGGG